MYAKLYKNYIFPFYETIIRRRKTLVYLEKMEKDQWLPEEELKDIQWQKLKRLLEHSYENVPYYRNKFKSAELKPGEIRTYDDFVKLPILTRENIRDNQKGLLAENYKDKKLLSKSTSGSTGVPLSFKYDRDAYEWHVAGAARGDRWADWDFGKKELYIWGRTPYKVPVYKKIKEALHHAIIRRKVIDTFSITMDNLKEKISRINSFKPAVIIGYASALYNLARFIKLSGLRCYSPNGIISSAEKLFPFQREMIESVFGTKVFDRYGCQEVMLIASECGEHKGFHMNIDNLYIEVLKDGRPARKGEAGEVVITDLNNYAMPFIRYRSGDLATLSAEKCACGRGLPLFERIEGRTIDTLYTQDGRIVSGEVFLYIIDRFDWVRQYKVMQSQRDSFVIQIVKEKTVTHIEDDLKLMEREMKSVFGDKTLIRFEFVDDIPLEPSGKNRFVISGEHATGSIKKIRVMHVLLSLEYGGAEKVVVNLIKNLQGGKFDFSICVLDRVGALKDELDRSIDIECMDRKSGIDFGLPARLAKIIKKSAPDIVHMHNSSALLYGAIAGKLAGVNGMIVTQHGSISAESPRMQFAVRQLTKAVDKTIPVSTDIERYLNDRFNIYGDRVETIINGIDDRIYRPDSAKRAELRKKFSLDGKIVVGHVARLSAEKDQKNLLEAFSVVAKEIENVKLIIVGDGPLRKELELLAKKLNITEKVAFIGFQSEIPGLLSMFDIFVLSSIREGTSLTLIEAMAVGLPIVATDVGGNPRVVDDNKTGILVSARDPEKLANAIVCLCKDENSRKEMGSAGRRRMVENFSLDKMAKKYSELYTELANK